MRPSKVTFEKCLLPKECRPKINARLYSEPNNEGCAISVHSRSFKNQSISKVLTAILLKNPFLPYNINFNDEFLCFGNGSNRLKVKQMRECDLLKENTSHFWSHSSGNELELPIRSTQNIHSDPKTIRIYILRAILILCSHILPVQYYLTNRSFGITVFPDGPIRPRTRFKLTFFFLPYDVFGVK